MNLVKLSLVAAAAAFTFSCSQATPPPATTNSASNAKNSTTTVSAVPPQVQNGPVGNVNAKNRLQTSAAAVDDEIAPEGNDVYAMNCVICHKDTGKGGKVTIKGKSLNAEDLTADKMKKLSDDKLFAYVSEGVPDEGMPSFKGKLSEDQIRSAVAHVRGLQAK